MLSALAGSLRSGAAIFGEAQGKHSHVNVLKLDDRYAAMMRRAC